MAVLRFGHLGICVTSLAASIPFYRDLLGFRTLTKVDVKGADADRLLRLKDVDQTTVFLERDGVRLALFEYRHPAPATRHQPRSMDEVGMAALMLRVDDLDATLAAMRAAGVNVLEDTLTDYPEFRSRLVFVTDPDATLIELVQIPGDPYAPFGKPFEG
ncbi:MAG TPA: VOC family protein [Candidatus Limnocylindrales bacterium]|nr:VOC family protein [Candidatus Limnocylindrales bacterium]